MSKVIKVVAATIPPPKDLVPLMTQLWYDALHDIAWNHDGITWEVLYVNASSKGAIARTFREIMGYEDRITDRDDSQL